MLESSPSVESSDEDTGNIIGAVAMPAGPLMLSPSTNSAFDDYR